MKNAPSLIIQTRIMEIFNGIIVLSSLKKSDCCIPLGRLGAKGVQNRPDHLPVPNSVSRRMQLLCSPPVLNLVVLLINRENH